MGPCPGQSAQESAIPGMEQRGWGNAPQAPETPQNRFCIGEVGVADDQAPRLSCQFQVLTVQSLARLLNFCHCSFMSLKWESEALPLETVGRIKWERTSQGMECHLLLSGSLPPAAPVGTVASGVRTPDPFPLEAHQFL